MPWVMRARGYTYKDGTERVVDCYVCDDGHITNTRAHAYVYETEADAWDHATRVGLVGEDETGPWCWVEPSEPGKDS